MTDQQEILILLPDTLYIKKMKPYQQLVTMHEEYNLYFKNIIYPYNESWDVYIHCSYGKNLGDCWRLSDCTEQLESFPLTVKVYNENGQCLGSKKTTVVLVDRVENTRTKIMFFGDSMTQSHIYVNHISTSLYGIDTVGTRSFDGHIYVEGRGGWTYGKYFTRWWSEFGWCPFLFPVGIAGSDYYGNMEFVDSVRNERSDTYLYYGYHFDGIKHGQYYTKEKKLYRHTKTGEQLISEDPQFTFDFAKYLERFSLEKPDIVSILMGANDLQVTPYERSEQDIEAYIENTKTLISHIRACDPAINIIVNLPVTGAEQYAWGLKLNCYANEKMYRFNIMHAAQRLIEAFDNKQKEGIYISPMIACIDPKNGFPHTVEKMNQYTEATEKKQSNWVHPNANGYMQMGDALASVIDHVRRKDV